MKVNGTLLKSYQKILKIHQVILLDQGIVTQSEYQDYQYDVVELWHSQTGKCLQRFESHVHFLYRWNDTSILIFSKNCSVTVLGQDLEQQIFLLMNPYFDIIKSLQFNCPPAKIYLSFFYHFKTDINSEFFKRLLRILFF